MVSYCLSLISALAIGVLSFAAALPFPLAANSITNGKQQPTLAPFMNGLNFPDPSVIRISDEWWAFSTMSPYNGKDVNVPMAHSYDFNTWTSFGEKDALPTLPSWVNPDVPAIWAPGVVQLASERFVMYYSAALESNPRLHCLGIASASTVTGPYTPIGSEPWVCPTYQGGAIDPAGYHDPKDNTRWVVYKVDANAIGHGGSCNNMVSAEDGFTKIGLPTPLIVNDPADGPYVGAPSLTKMSDGTYVLYYSSNCFLTPLYDVSYATSKNIKGPYKKFGGLMKTGTYGLTAPGGLDMAINGYHAVFHADWNGGRAMFTGTIRGHGDKLQVHIKDI
ncbi:glycoside hydrolase family 43 protein [Aureobasidium sp. EXF-8845]|nr:glycoside hydrolase family 43 protein [Aureobasidium sp. EXF-8845]KAI4856033.1 glycoside hydrolase family 43 protein [Aureobasidium sp. EXF-8846]